MTPTHLAAILDTAGFARPSEAALTEASQWLTHHKIDERLAYACADVELTAQLFPPTETAYEALTPYAWAMRDRGPIPAHVFDAFGRAHADRVAA